MIVCPALWSCGLKHNASSPLADSDWTVAHMEGISLRSVTNNLSTLTEYLHPIFWGLKNLKYFLVEFKFCPEINWPPV